MTKRRKGHLKEDLARLENVFWNGLLQLTISSKVLEISQIGKSIKSFLSKSQEEDIVIGSWEFEEGVYG
ncbi:hypothetical protein BY996DRAFT_6500979, partial [Phakopsora pachyrhizi]